MTAAVAPMVFSGAAVAQEAGAERTDEIVVTGLKRGDLDLVETPAGVTVIGGDAIEDLGADSLTDFLQLVPGASIDVGVTAGGTTNIQIRGVNTTFGAASVGFYMDDLPFSFITTNVLPDPSPFDLQSVEVLRGPQGALYGAGSSGGVVLIRTNDPVLNEFSGKLDVNGSATDDGTGNYSASGAVNIPLISDRMALRGSVSYQDNSGWIDDTLVPGETNLNDEQRLNGRVKLLTQLTDNLSVQLQAVFSRIDLGTGTNTSDDSGNLPFVSFLAPTLKRGASTDYDQYGAIIKYQGPWFSVQNSLGYINFDSSFSSLALPIANETDIETISNELRINSDHEGPISWVAGFFYKDTEQITFQDFSVVGPLLMFPDGFNLDDVHTSEQFSIYGEATLSLADGAFEISAGGSYFEDETELSSNLTGFLTTPLANNIKTDIFSPQVTVAYHPTENSTVYARYAQGFRPGTLDFGFSTFSAQLAIPTITGAVTVEESEAYEVGAKAELLDGLVYVDVALFLTEIEDIHQSAAVVVPGGAISANTILNAGEARTAGVEWTLSANPTDRFNLTFTGAYVDAEISEDFFAPGVDPSDPASTPLFTEGTRLNAVPELTLNGQASYTWPLGVAGLDATASANIQYSSDRALTVLSAPSVEGDDITRANLRFEVGRDAWSVYAFADNLTNESGLLVPTSPAIGGIFGASSVPIDGILGSRIRPRTIGGGVRVRF